MTAAVGINPPHALGAETRLGIALGVELGKLEGMIRHCACAGDEMLLAHGVIERDIILAVADFHADGMLLIRLLGLQGRQRNAAAGWTSGYGWLRFAPETVQ